MGRMKLGGASGTIGKGTVRGATLPEALVAAVIFLTLFTLTLGLLPRLAVRDDDGLLVAEAEYRTARAAERYGSGLWPDGEYAERYEWGEVTIRVEPHREYADVQCITLRARIDASRKRIARRILVERTQ